MTGIMMPIGAVLIPSSSWTRKAKVEPNRLTNFNHEIRQKNRATVVRTKEVEYSRRREKGCKVTKVSRPKNKRKQGCRYI